MKFVVAIGACCQGVAAFDSISSKIDSMKSSALRRRTRAGLCLACGLLTFAVEGQPTTNAVRAQSAHAQGTCGSLGPGTGLVQGKGWIVSMLPGTHELRIVGGGEVFLTAARLRSWSFDAGRPYYISIEGSGPRATLEWKVPGKGWAAVPTTFLYPPQGVSAAR